MSFGISSFTARLESHDENVDFAFENVVVTAVTVFLAACVLFIDLKEFINNKITFIFLFMH